jgi:hypothetical protein
VNASVSEGVHGTFSRRWPIVAAVIAAVVALSVPAAASAMLRSQPRTSLCSAGFVSAVVGGKVKCLHAGEFCAPRYERQYEAHRFQCISGRLQRFNRAPQPVVGSAAPHSQRLVARRRTAQAGEISALLTYSELRSDSLSPVKKMHLTIRRGGAVAYTSAIRSTGHCARIPTPLPPFRSLAVAEFDGNTESEVVLTLNCGGAHGRAYSFFFTYVPSSGRYQRTLHWWQEFQPKIKDLDGDGTPEFRSADSRFSYVFTSFAESANPVQIWSLRSGTFTDVTRTFPSVITTDRNFWWQQYLKYRRDNVSDVRGYLAAYMADEYLLGQEEQGWASLQEALARGDLSRKYLFPPLGAAYLTELAGFLAKTGYAS